MDRTPGLQPRPRTGIGIRDAISCAVLAAVDAITHGSLLALLLSLGARFIDRRYGPTPDNAINFTTADRPTWRMRPLDQLPPPRLTVLDRTWLIVLRGYLFIAAGLVLVRIVLLIAPGS